MSYLCVCHVFYWIWMRSLQRHKLPWYISVTVPGYDCCNILCNNPASAKTRKWPFGCWGSLIFYFLVVQITLTGIRESSFPAESDSSLGFNTTSPNSKHISPLLQFSACVMTAFLCCDSDSGGADEKSNAEEREFTLRITGKGTGRIERDVRNGGMIDAR